mmetsp:Transcript_6795/g.27732  ORF Transcript_6795/g.27732 Transcript_6795/m.27732 type:complete len:284 (+) Transcript_6795:3020-3871(+)
MSAEGPHHAAHRVHERRQGCAHRGRRSRVDAGGAREGVRQLRLQRGGRFRVAREIFVEVLVGQRADELHHRGFVRGDVGGHDVVLRAAARQPVLDELLALLLFDDAHVLEPRIDEHVDEVLSHGSPGYSAGERLVRLEVLGEFLDVHHVRDGESASGLEDPESLAQNPGFVRREVDDAVGDDRVRPVVFARQVLDLPEPELQAGRGELGLEGLRPRAREHLGRHVDADDAPRGSHGVRGEEAVYPRAAAEVEHVLPGLEPRQTDGCAAADAQFGVADERQIPL